MQHYTLTAQRASNTQCDSRERSKFLGFQKKFQNPSFIKNLGIMLDALQELSELSLALQKADVTLPTARQLDVFTARKCNGGYRYSYACHAVKVDKVFFGITVDEPGCCDREINRAQFYQSLYYSINARLLPAKEHDISNAVAVLDTKRWQKELSPEFGEQ